MVTVVTQLVGLEVIKPDNVCELTNVSSQQHLIEVSQNREY